MDMDSTDSASAIPFIQLSQGLDSISLPSTTALLLDDILWPIFQLLVPPPGTVNFSFRPGLSQPYYLAHRTASALPLVCRAWYHAAVAHLYNDAIVRCFPQVALLARTLRQDPDKFGPLVRRLTFAGPMYDGLVPMDDIHDILARCPFLRGVSFVELADVWYPSQFTLQAYSDLEDMGLREESIAFNLNMGMPYHSLGVIPLPSQTIANLQCLSIRLNCTDIGKLQQALVFPSLHTLTLWAVRRYPVAYFPVSWVTPSLKDLRLRPTLAMGSAPNFQRFLDSRASHLESLDLGGTTDFQPYTTDYVGDVVRQCGELKHLVFQLPPEDVAGECYLLTHSLQFVDVIIQSGMCSHQPLVIPKGSKWAHIRYIDRPLLDLFPDIAHILPPTESPPLDEITADVYGVTVRQRGPWIYQHNWLGFLSRDRARAPAACCFPDLDLSAVQADDESETDSLYEPGSSDETETGSEESDTMELDNDTDSEWDRRYTLRRR